MNTYHAGVSRRFLTSVSPCDSYLPFPGSHANANEQSYCRRRFAGAYHIAAHRMGHWWLRPLQATARGAGITLGSTVISCGLAIQVEKNANRLFFYAAPHWYANVDYAYGITDEQLASVRHLGGCTAESTASAWDGSSLTPQQSPPSEATDDLDACSNDTKFLIPHDRSEASAPKTVVMIPLGDIMSSALTG